MRVKPGGHLCEKLIVSADKDSQLMEEGQKKKEDACSAQGTAKKKLLVGNDFVGQVDS